LPVYRLIEVDDDRHMVGRVIVIDASSEAAAIEAAASLFIESKMAKGELWADDKLLQAFSNPRRSGDGSG